MTDLSSKASAELAGRFVSARLAALEAYRARDIPKHNRWFKRAMAAAEALLTRGDAGRAEVEKLMLHASPSVRLGAAAYVIKWSPNAAVPVLEKILLWADNDRTERLFGESMNVQLGAEMILARHYHLNILDIRDFIRAKHGLPPKPHVQTA